MQRTSEEGIDHIKRWEGLRLTAYQDTGGVWTIGYGDTTNVKPGLVISENEADARLREDLKWAEAAVSDLVAVPLTQHQFDALVSFVYNVGRTQFAKSTLLRLLNAGDYDAVPEQLARWKYDNGKVIEGLANRRAAEAGLWARGSHVASRTAPASAPKPPKPILAPEQLATAGTAVTGLIASLVDVQGPIAYALSAVVVLAGVTACLLIARRLWSMA